MKEVDWILRRIEESCQLMMRRIDVISPRPLLKARSGLLLCLVCLVLGACSAIQQKLSFIPGIPDPRDTSIREVVLEAAGDANNTSGTTVDFLFIFDAAIVSNLPTSSPEWFTNRELLISNHAKNMVVAYIGIAPGTTETLNLPDGYRDARDVIAYADYIPAQGQKWYRVLDVKEVKVTLSKSSIAFQDASKN